METAACRSHTELGRRKLVRGYNHENGAYWAR